LILFCDEGVDRQIVHRLRDDGHEVTYVAELAPGISDDEVLERANTLAGLLITMDKDFGELVYRLGRISHGVLLVRLHAVTPNERAEAVSGVIREHGPELSAAFSVLSPSKLRIRRSDRGEV
jgi:predicted nuclease of predicted toxin-antitoxin system